MAKSIGREVTMTWAGAAIPGVREKGVQFNGAPIDISDDDSAGVRELLDEVGEMSVDINISGLADGDTLAVAASSLDARTQVLVLTYPNGRTLSGQFMLVSYSENGAYKGERTFDAQFQSAGAWTLTPGS